MVPCVVCSVFFCEYRLNLKWWFNINMFNAYPWVTLDYLCNFALRNLYSFQSLVNLILLDLYARCLLLLIFRSCLFIKEWLYRWYVCGHYILDVFLKLFYIVLMPLDLVFWKWLRLSERHFFIPLYIGFFQRLIVLLFFGVVLLLVI